MAEYHNQQHEEVIKTEDSSPAPVESTDRGLFDFGKKKDEEVISSEFEEKVTVSEVKAEEEKHHDHKLHRSHSSSSSSSSDDEEGDEEEKKKKKKEKKSIKDKIKEKLPGHHDQDKKEEVDTAVPVEKIHVEEEQVVYSETSTGQEEKKGFLDKIKEKLPGQQPAAHDVASPHPAVEGEEKKGFLDKIKDKIPGFHSKAATDEEKEKAKD